MPISQRYLTSEDLFITVWDGPVTFEECLAAARQNSSDPEWLRGRRRLTDATTADPSAFIVGDFDEIVSTHKDIDIDERLATKLAIVAPHGLGVAQQAEQHARRLGVNVFVCDTVRSACVWLGVDADTARRAIRALRTGAADA